MDVTVVITTKNRIDCLPRAVESALAQHGNVEVLVIDDGSTDGTAEVIRQRFPAARVVRDDVSRGLIVQRNRAARLARGRILLSIDDDAVLTTPDLAGQVVACFDHPRIGLLAIPVWHVHSFPDVHHRPPSPDGRWITDNFVGTAYAVRRDVFLSLGGFRELFFHQGEERDFALRLLAAGYVIRLAPTDRIDHFESPRRSFTRMDRYGRRNEVLYAAFNLPLSTLPAALARFTLAGLRRGVRVGRPWNMVVGLAWGYVDAVRYRRQRRPVSKDVWRLFRELATPRELAAIEARLPPMRPVEAGTDAVP
ncbi:MAG: glycosyltransferase family 2 protein [Tepidisphaerales bacterium]